MKQAYKKSMKMFIENKKKSSGGLLNSIGTFKEDIGDGTFGLTCKAKAEVKNKYINEESSSSSDSDNNKIVNMVDKSKDTDFIFENETINKNNNINILDMEDLFNVNNSKKINNEDIFYDFTKK